MFWQQRVTSDIITSEPFEINKISRFIYELQADYISRKVG